LAAGVVDQGVEEDVGIAMPGAGWRQAQGDIDGMVSAASPVIATEPILPFSWRGT